MRRMLCVVGLIVLGTMLTACFDGAQTTQKGDEIMRLAIFPSGYSETYLFEVKQDGTMLCQLGTRRNDNIRSTRFYRSISEQREVKLSDEEMQRIIALADELKANGYPFEKRIYLDSWDVSLSYCGEVYESNYWNNPSTVFRELADEIIGLSAIPVDLHGWA